METEPSVGTQLRQAREALNQTLEDAHKGCGVSLNVLKDLEAGTCNAVEPVFARFALRSYAQYLKLEIEPLEKLFDRQFGSRPRQYQVQQNTAPMPVAPSGIFASKQRLGVIVGIIILLISIGLLFWQAGSSAGPTAQTLRSQQDAPALTDPGRP